MKKVEVLKEGVRLNGEDLALGEKVQIEKELLKIWIPLGIAAEVVDTPKKETPTEKAGEENGTKTNNTPSGGTSNASRSKAPHKSE